MKPIALAIIIRSNAAGNWEILTHLRLVQNKQYDPLYDRTMESVGETLEKHDSGYAKETFLEAAIRGIREECGMPDDFEPVFIYGAGMKRLDPRMTTTGKGDSYFVCEPFCLVQSMGPPQPWFGPAFLAKVPSDFEPNYAGGDGEAGEPRWWSPKDLLAAIKHEPAQFMGLHIEALRLAATELS